MSNPRMNYESPNIVIVPTVSFCGPPAKKQKPNNECAPPQTPVAPVEIASNPSPVPCPVQNVTNTMHTIGHYAVHSKDNLSSSSCVEDAEHRVKKTLSWASNYLHSIGQSQPKVTKLTNIMQQKYLPKVEESKQQTVKNVFKSTFTFDVSQSHPNSSQKSSSTIGGVSVTPMELNHAKTDDKNNLKQTNHPIKINLLCSKQDTNPHATEDETIIQHSTNIPKTTSIENPKIVMSSDLISPRPYSKTENNIKIDKYIRDEKTKNHENRRTEKKDSYSVSHTKYNLNKDNKNNSTEKYDKSIHVKMYSDSKDRYKDLRESKTSTRTKNTDIYKSSKYKTKDRLEAWASDRIKSSSKNTFKSYSKDRLESRMSDKIKTNSGRAGYSESSRSSSKNLSKDQVKPKYIESASKLEKGNNESNTKSKPPTNSNETCMKKASDIPQTTPMKSVVQVTKKYDFDNSSKRKYEHNHNPNSLRTKHHLQENYHSNEDLRNKLKRKHEDAKRDRDHLVITVQNENNNDKEEKDNKVKQTKTKEKPKSEKTSRKYKKIKLVINVVCENCSESTESDSDDEEHPIANADLSFLDDFNVDDIVESLNDEEHKANVVTNTPMAKNSKHVINEQLVDKPKRKNDDVEEWKCPDLQKRFQHYDSTAKFQNLHQQKVYNNFGNNNDQKHKTTENTKCDNQASNNVFGLIQNNPETINLHENSVVVLQQNSYDTNYITEPDNQVEIENICRPKINEKTEKLEILHPQNKIEDEKPTDIESYKQSNGVNIDTTTEATIKYLTAVKTKYLSSNSETHDSEILTQESRNPTSKNIFADNEIIDLTEPKTPPETKEIPPSVVLATQADEIFETNNNTKEDKLESNPLQLEVNTTQETLTINEILDLTISTETIVDVEKDLINSSDIPKQMPCDQSPACSDNLGNNNINKQPQELDTIHEDVTNTEQDQKIINNEGANSVTTEVDNIQTTKTVSKPKKHEICLSSLINAGKHDLATEYSNSNEVRADQETGPRLQQCNENESTETNIITQETTVKIDTANVSSTEIKPVKHEYKDNKEISKSENNVESIKIETVIPNIDNKKVLKVAQHDNKDSKSASEEVIATKIQEEILPNNCNKTPILYSPTCSVKTDTKEVTNEIKSVPEANTKDKDKVESNTADKNKVESNTAAIASLKWKLSKQLLGLETRMLKYFGKKYTIESLINHGRFSKIYQCKNEDGRNYALKLLSKGNRITGCRIEDMLKTLQKDIPRQNYHCVFLIDGFAWNGHWCFVMDYYPRNMQEVMYENGKCFHIDAVQTLARQLISAVLILRNNNIMHLDIKPSHILMNTSNDRLKLAGFDESQYLHGLSVLPCIGTVNYRPPEVILGFPYFAKIDVWSTALVIYEMCTNRQLFPGIYNNDILYKQMCTLGNIPFDMVMQSVFASQHYRGANFARRYGPVWQQCTLIDNFKKSKRLPTSLFEAYHRDWAKTRTKKQREEDSRKLRILLDLLEEMLHLNPMRRTPIEFVYANSFIYETFDSCAL